MSFLIHSLIIFQFFIQCLSFLILRRFAHCHLSHIVTLITIWTTVQAMSFSIHFQTIFWHSIFRIFQRFKHRHLFSIVILTVIRTNMQAISFFVHFLTIQRLLFWLCRMILSYINRLKLNLSLLLWKSFRLYSLMLILLNYSKTIKWKSLWDSIKRIAYSKKSKFIHWVLEIAN